MKDKFKGFKSVYFFTLKQSTKGVGFKIVTGLIFLLILGGFVVINIFVAKPDKEDDKDKSPIETVYVLDQSHLQSTDYKESFGQNNGAEFSDIVFNTVSDLTREELIEEVKASSKSLAVIITESEAGYELEALILDGSEIKKKDANTLLEAMSSSFETNKLMQSGLTIEQLTTVLMPVQTSYHKVGEDKSIIAYLIKLMAPMVFGLMLYMMLIIYGQTVSKSVSTEKTSKLMETLLTSIHPYALISGKILAVTSMAMLQFISWLLAGFIGLYGGNAVAHVLYPEYQNTAITIIDFIKDNVGDSALSLPAIILAILAFCAGFLFFNMLAGLAGCMVSKPEDVATTQSLFQFPVIISWLICYFAPLIESDTLSTVIRFVPLTAPFCLPVELITGSIGLLQGGLALVVLLMFTFFSTILSGRLYKGLILYTGQKISFKMLGNILTTNE